ncbi:hypothetical protein [Polluticoccus soli]|uniref:hypothetical protein n=1 Tax=Polluticoccus soli TaxID=3034150 RepID=UPI0023E15CC8|nr:hypothetical protein [Flavipsychrobacter sp. JY13-12]
MFKSNRVFIALDEPTIMVEKEYNISDLLKQATQIKNQQDYTAAIDFLEETDSMFGFSGNEYTRVAKRLIDYYSRDKSKKHLRTELYSRVFSRIALSPYEPVYIDIHKLYAASLPLEDGIKYLLQIIDKENLADYEHKHFYFELANKYKDSGRFGEAREIYNRLFNKLNPAEPFEFKRLYSQISFELSDLFLKLKPLDWLRQFMYFRSLGFVYDILCDIDMTVMARFFHRRKICDKREWGEDETIDEVLDGAGLGEKKDPYYKSLFDYAFRKMPLQVGFPKKHLDENEYKKFQSSKSFIYEVIKFDCVLGNDGLPLRDELGLEVKKRFQFVDEVNDSVRNLVDDILNIV